MPRQEVILHFTHIISFSVRPNCALSVTIYYIALEFLTTSSFSAANDFWGKTYLQLSGRAKMDQQLSILTGCSAGATESFVVVPFELVKIR